MTRTTDGNFSKPAPVRIKVLTVLALALSGVPSAAFSKSRAEEVPFGGAMRGTLTNEEVVVSVRMILIALDQANKTGNYSVFRDLASEEFQKNSLQDISNLFSNLRSNRIDLSRSVSIDPILTIPPEIISNGMLRVAGYFPSMPEQVHFDLLFVKSKDRWKMYGIFVGTQNTEPMTIEKIESQR